MQQQIVENMLFCILWTRRNKFVGGLISFVHMQPGLYIAEGGGGGRGAVAPARKTKFFFSNIVFDKKPCLYTGDPCEGLWSLPPQTEFFPADKKS